MVLPIRGELLINGTWTDVTSRMRQGGNMLPVSITDGSSAEQFYTTPGGAVFTLNNQNGDFTDTNPYSPYFGQLGRNTQFRIGLTGTKYLRMIGSSGDDGNYGGATIQTADKAALDVTGDIDIRWDGEAEDWVGSYGQILAAKWVDSSQASWILFTQQGGDLYFAHTTGGTTATVEYLSPNPTNQAIVGSGRIALRFTLDVDNGAGGHQATWYKSDTINGTWTQIFQATYAGTRSIFNSTAPLEIGTANNGGGRYAPIAGAAPFVGKVYGFELRNGIGGTVVAKMDATGQTRGATTWSDGLGNTWTVAGDAVVDDMDYRFWGECAQLPQEWDTSGRDVWSTVQAGDIIQRLTQGQRQFSSPIYRNLVQYTKPNSANSVAASAAPYVTGYWPLEDNIGAVVGKDAAQIGGSYTSWDVVPGSAGVLAASTDQDSLYCQSIPVSWPAGNKHVAYWSWYHQWTASTGATAFELPFNDGTLRQCRITLFVGSMSLDVLKNDGSVWKTYSLGYGGTLTINSIVAHRVMLTHDTSAATIKVEWAWYRVGDTVFYGNTATEAAGSEVLGRPRGFYARGDYSGRAGLKLAHIVTAQTDVIPFVSSDFIASTTAYQSESAFNRFSRLMREEGIDYWIRGIGDLEGSRLNPAMGYQTLSTVWDLAVECAAAIGGVLYGPRDKFGLGLRMLSSMTGRDSFAPVLSYGATSGKYHLSGQLKPAKVTQNIHNYVIASRPNSAGTRIVEKTSGPLNTSDPKLNTGGVGFYDFPITRNVSSDAALQSQASWEVALGTEDAVRWPNIEIELHRAVWSSSAADIALATAVRAMALGDPFVITGMPVGKGGPNDIVVLYRGRTEVLENLQHTITINATPYGPYQWGQIASATYHEGAQRRQDSSSATLAATYSSSATSMGFSCSKAESAWSRNTPYDVLTAGERLTVTQAGSKGSLAGDLGQFEQGSVAGWTPSGGTTSAAIDATRARYGTQSAKLTVAGSPATVTYLLASSANYGAVTVGNTYTATAWLYASGAVTASMIINWHTSGNAYISTSTGTSVALAANTWTKVTVTATAPATAAKANPGPQLTGSPANGTTLNVDSIEVVDPLSSVCPVVVTRAVNGITKSLPSGSAVRVVESMRWGRI